MSYYVYILYSEKLGRYYIGQTQDVEKRLAHHNSGYSTYTKCGIPWVLKCFVEVSTRGEAIKLERKLKNFKSQARLEHWIGEVVGSEK